MPFTRVYPESTALCGSASSTRWMSTPKPKRRRATVNNIERLEELFPRYWASALTPDERRELELLLAAAPEPREALLLLTLQAGAPAELSAVHALVPAPEVPP